MAPLNEAILALAIANAPPGRSPYSLELLPECGSDPRTPSCEIKPLCPEPLMTCRPPRWSALRNAWVRYERPEAAVRRYARIADAIVDTAQALVSCKGADEALPARCEPAGWVDDARTLALASLAVALHESGLREDIQFGRPPLGRGPAGEVCLVQVAPEQAPLYASWLPKERRELVAADAKLREEFARTLLGETPVALRRCFEVGMRMLARSRQACAGASRSWDFGMFSMYGTGTTCNGRGMAERRHRTFRALLAAKPRLSPAHEAMLREQGAVSSEPAPEPAPTQHGDGREGA